MCTDRPAPGEILENLVTLGAIGFPPEPLDAIVERRFKSILAVRSCSNCSEDKFHYIDTTGRVWCGRCDWKTTYTRGTPFYDSELAPSEFLIAFVPYADTLLSINQIAFVLTPSYKTLYDRIKETETAFIQEFLLYWIRR